MTLILAMIGMLVFLSATVWCCERLDRKLHPRSSPPPRWQWNEDDPEFMAHIERQIHGDFETED